MLKIKSGKYWQIGIELISGCTPCSPGCDHCWSAALAHRFKRDKMNSFDLNPTQYTNERGAFDGRVMIHPERLKRFSTRQPKVFAIWNDLYHEAVPFEFQHSVYSAMLENRHNTYFILTKRPKEMMNFWGKVSHFEYHTDIWHGLTICNQQEADEKIPIFLQVPGKKFLCIEPCLGNIYLTEGQSGCLGDIDAVILGGETGPGARPLHPDWVRSVRDQCASADVPFFFKNWGEYGPEQVRPIRFTPVYSGVPMDQPVSMFKVGREKAGRLLDGRTHDELPWGR